MKLRADALQMANDPAVYFGGVGYAAHHVPLTDLPVMQLSALAQRFDSLRNRVGALQALADERGIYEIETLNDVVPLLFPHTMYKSYPASLLENDRYDLLTRWLNRLTTS